MNSRTLILLAQSSVFALFVACGGAQPSSEPVAPEAPEAAPAEAAPTPGAAEAAPEAGSEAAPDESVPAKPFAEMSAAEKLKFMKAAVAPQMAKTFQGFNAEHYAEFGCVTCHGPGAKDGNFQMPSAALPKLPTDPRPLFKDKPEVTKFMAEQVVPQMAKLLGTEPFNPETGKGFGCFNCHQKQ